MMERRGRPPLGDDHIESLAGGEEEKRRLRVILRTLSGELTIREAGEELDLSDRRIHQLRRRALEGALGALEARPVGRPPRAGDIDLDPDRVASIERDLEETRLALELTEIRGELDRGLWELGEKKGSAPLGPNRAERRQRAREERRGR
jgi:hypothetical protein